MCYSKTILKTKEKECIGNLYKLIYERVIEAYSEQRWVERRNPTTVSDNGSSEDKL